MEIHYSLDTFSAKNPVLTIGMFDGVHVGHQTILTRLNKASKDLNGESVLLTFWPHPRMLFGDSDNFRILTTCAEKHKRLELSGLDHCVILPFTNEFLHISAEDFITKILHKGIGVSKVIIGYDHKYGYKGTGDYKLLETFGEKLGFSVEEIDPFYMDELPVSSTKIRSALQNGEIEKAQKLLGYTYSMRGMVIHGKKIGRTIGAPTANIFLEESRKIIPEKGVYVAAVLHNDTYYNAVVSIGLNPTINSENQQIKIEAHLLDFSEDIYNKTVRIFFLHKIRDEIKYDSLDDLKKGIQNDFLYTRKYFTENDLRLLKL